MTNGKDILYTIIGEQCLPCIRTQLNRGEIKVSSVYLGTNIGNYALTMRHTSFKRGGARLLAYALAQWVSISFFVEGFTLIYNIRLNQIKYHRRLNIN